MRHHVRDSILLWRDVAENDCRFSSPAREDLNLLWRETFNIVFLYQLLNQRVNGGFELLHPAAIASTTNIRVDKLF
jgi:hypothetical protein